MLATKLTQSPWFLKTPKVFQPPFLHWSVDVGSVAISATKASEPPALVVWAAPAVVGKSLESVRPSRTRCRVVHGDAGAGIRTVAPQVGRKTARIRSRRASSHDVEILAGVVCAPQRSLGNRWSSLARHIGTTSAVYGDVTADVSSAAAQVGRKD